MSRLTLSLTLLVLALLLTVESAGAAALRPDPTPVLHGALVTTETLPDGHGEITWHCITGGVRTAWGNPEVGLGVYAIPIAWGEYCEARANWYDVHGALVAQSALVTLAPVRRANRADFVLLPH